MITLDGTNGITTPMPGTVSEHVTSPTGFKNRLINGRMRIAQRGTSATITAGTAVPTISTGYPCVDRWFVYSVGGNPTAAQVTGAGPDQNQLQITGAASVTQIGVGQRIEQNNSYDLNGSTCTLSVDLSNSLLTTVTWTASYANTIDTFGTIGTPTKTQIATGTFTVTSTLTNYNVQIAIPSAATTGIEILFTVGAQTSGTWVIDDVQLEKSPYPTSYDYRDYGRELIMCQRYHLMFGGNLLGTSWCLVGLFNSTSVGVLSCSLPVVLRTVPTVITYGSALLTSATVSSTVTIMTLTGYSKHSITFTLTGTGTPYTVNHPALAAFTNDIQLAAEIA